MIYYFSGTGNSEWIAKKLAGLTGEEAVCIAGLMREVPAPIIAGEDSRVGLVFPVYSWAPPKMMMEFAKGIKARNTYCYAVCTCGDEAGRAIYKLSKVLPLQAAWSVKMPNNYVPMFDVDTKEVAHQKVEAAANRISGIAQAILRGQSVFDVEEGSLPRLKTTLIAPIFHKFAMSDKPFYAEDTCTSCGLCEKLCPTHNIRMAEGKPAWQGHCTQCLACLHRCPQAAIQYGRGTREKGRYYFGKDF